MSITISGSIGTLVSGVAGATRPDFNALSYLGKSGAVYQIPYPNEANLNTKGFKISATDEKSSAKIIENQLVGVSRTHTRLDGVTFDGVYQDESNHPSNNLIISVSGVEAYINNLYVGGINEKFAWSGLSHGSVNYLWINLVEEDPDRTVGHKSSRQFRQFETRSTTTTTPPVGPERSLLLAAFESGVGININPTGKEKIQLVSDHVEDNQNPHGTKIFVDNILASGVYVQGTYEWDPTVAGSVTASGAIIPRNLRYLNELEIPQFTTLCNSGICGNILSGSTEHNFYKRTGITFVACNANFGTLCVASGASISGSFFRVDTTLPDNVLVDGFDFSDAMPLVSKTCLSGTPVLHEHSFLSSSGETLSFSPIYPGVVFKDPGYEGNRSLDEWIWGYDLGVPTLRHWNEYYSNLYLQVITPPGRNALESVSVVYRQDSGSNAFNSYIIDALGNSLVPRQGSSLSSSGTQTFVISGFDQTNIQQHFPVTLNLDNEGISGLNQYLGDIKFHFRTQ